MMYFNIIFGNEISSDVPS